MRKTVLTYGIIAGFIVGVIGMTIMALQMGDDGKMNLNTGQIIGYATMLVALSMVFFGVRQYRDRHQNGFISFGKAFQVGILITLIACVFYVAGWLILFNTSEAAQAFPSHYIEHMRSEWAKAGMTAAEIDAKVAPLEKSMEQYASNPLLMIAYTFIEIFPLGLIITLISAIILKRKPVQLMM